jgi:hypothetical protein
VTEFKHYTFATPDQELLLKAALMHDDEAVAAWKEWQSRVDLENHLDQGSFRLLPLLYTILQKKGIDDPLMGKLKGIYRQAWSKNQTLFHEMAPVVKHLQSAGIKTMLLKGAPLSLLYYKNNGARPMADIDVLVPRAQVLQAYRLLNKAGWCSPLPLTEMDLHFGHAIQLENSAGLEFDLHWRPFNGCSNAYESDFWDSALEVVMADVTSLAPNPTNMLFHVIIHGVPWNPVPPIRWIADAVSLMKTPDKIIDWRRLINLAEKHHVGLRLKVGLRYLHDKFQSPIPEEIMQRAEVLPVSYLEEMEDRFMMTTRENKNSSPYTAFFCHLCRYRRLTAADGLFALFGFPRYLQWRLNATHFYDLMFKGVLLMGNMLLSKPFAVRPR